MLMMITNPESHNYETWYIDIGCSNHMTSHRDWLVSFYAKKKSIIRFEDNRVIQDEGVEDVLVTKQDGRKVVISYVLYVPGMKSNFISTCKYVQLLEA